MNAEIERLRLPRGVWQKAITDTVPKVTRVECSYPDANTVQFQLYAFNETPVAHFSLSFLYGCKGILVSHSAAVEPSYRRKGIAKKLQPIKDKVARDLRVSVMLGTVREDNTAQKKVFAKEWKKLDTFTNTRTGNNVGIHIKKVQS